MAISEPIFLERSSRPYAIACTTLGGILGGLAARSFANLEAISGPVPQSLTMIGEGFFFIIGAVPAMLVSWAITRRSHPVPFTNFQAAKEITAVGIASLGVGVAAVMVFLGTFLTAPREFVELLIKSPV